MINDIIETSENLCKMYAKSFHAHIYAYIRKCMFFFFLIFTPISCKIVELFPNVYLCMSTFSNALLRGVLVLLEWYWTQKKFFQHFSPAYFM